MKNPVITLWVVFLLMSSVSLNAQYITNGNFSDALNSWHVYENGEATATGEVINGMFNMNIENPGTEVWHLQLVQYPIPLARGGLYTLSFKAAADSNRTIRVGFSQNSGNYDYYSSSDFSLTTDTTEFSYTFIKTGATDSLARIVFNFGGNDKNVRLGNIKMTKFGEEEEQPLKMAPFSKGVNVTNWFQAPSPQQIDFTKFTKEDFENIKSLGADVIRLPINLHSMVGPEPNYELDPLFLTFMDQVVDWAEELEIHLILDNHTFDPSVDTELSVQDILIPVWHNMATHYKDRSELIHFEILNEPHGISEAAWNSIQARAVEAIREVDSTRSIIIGGSSFNSFNSLQYIPEYADTNLIYTYHFYDPFILSHQGATWTDPSMLELAGVPFPYDASNMPEFPSSLSGTWMESSFNNYQNEGTEEHVKEVLDIAITFAKVRGVPIFCGELGVYKPNSDNDSRVNWYGLVTDYLTEHGVAWTSWDYKGGFGIFENGTDELFDYHLNIPLIEAMGFNVPQQYEYETKADTIGFEIYTDFIAEGITNGSGSGSNLSFYDESAPKNGDFSIFWTDADQYNSITFNFSPDKDLSYITEYLGAVSMWVKGDTPGSDFDLRFIDSKTEEPGDHPWRMFKRITESDVNFNGEWQYLEVPLSDFTEMGSWDNNQWHEPQGDYDWSAVDNFNIVAESGAHSGEKFWFDDISIIMPAINSVEENDEIGTFKLFQNYPNPFNPETIISFQLTQSRNVSLKVYDLLGREVSSLFDGQKSSGEHRVSFNASGLSSGVYIYELRAGNLIQQKRMVLIK